MSPEQAEGKKVDHRSDIYSLGVIAFEMLAGMPPFVSETPVGVLVQHLQSPPPLLRSRNPDVEIPESFEELITACLAKDPDARPQSVKQIRTRLDQWVSETVEVSPGMSPQVMADPSAGSSDSWQQPDSVPSPEGLAQTVEARSAPALDTTSGLGPPQAQPKKLWRYLAVLMAVAVVGAVATVFLMERGKRDDSGEPLVSKVPLAVDQTPDTTSASLEDTHTPVAPADTTPTSRAASEPDVADTGSIASVAKAVASTAAATEVVASAAAATEVAASEAKDIVKPRTRTTVAVRFESRPDGARVYLRDSKKLLGTTPFFKSFATSSATMTVVFKKRGYDVKTVRVSPRKTRHVSVKLKKKKPPSDGRGGIIRF